MKPAVLSHRFTWADVQRSATAQAKGIDNTLPDELVVNAARVAQFVECVDALIGGLAITSWYRNPAVNQAVGSKSTSMHLQALAVDLVPVNVSLDVAFERVRASALPYDQVIIERTVSGSAWLHVGLSIGKPRREALRARGATLGGPMTFERVAVG